MRLVDADTIRYDQLLNTGNKEHPLEWAVSRPLIDAMPTIEAEPIKHGQWIDEKCSVCNYGVESWNVGTNYCPNCGAKMRCKVRAFTDKELKTYQEVIERKSIPTSVNIMNVMDGEKNG